MRNGAIRIGAAAVTRERAVQRLRARLLREGFPRAQMFILVSLTGLAGFGASAALLAVGIDSMGLRYLLAMGVAYLAFLALLWLWLRTSAADWLDAVPADAFGSGDASANADFGPKDGGFDGIVEKPFEAVAQAEEGAIPLAVILLVLGIALSSLFVVWSAPVLFAEILVDALLAAGLYRRLRVLDAGHWMRAAVKRTVIPFVLTALVVTGAGFAMQAHLPEARSLGDVIRQR